ncbi:hypothetical protein JCM10207_007124 [Rhodosporidiobolus poonsookiae]
MAAKGKGKGKQTHRGTATAPPVAPAQPTSAEGALPPPPPSSHPQHPSHPAPHPPYYPFTPTSDTAAWLYSLPLPPGVAQQPLPQTPQDWALVEQYRLLCQGLLVMGEFERERMRRRLRGEDEWREWDPRESNNPHIISAAHSLFKHDLALQASAAAYTSAYGSAPAAYPPYFPQVEARAGEADVEEWWTAEDAAAFGAEDEHYPPPSHPYLAAPSALDEEDEDEYDDADADGSYLHGDGDADADAPAGEGDAYNPLGGSTPYDRPTLSTLRSFATASPLDPSALPLSLDLSALTAAVVSPSGSGEGGEGGPASLPSLMAAIAELEQCVARLSLEATEARNLQKSLRDEMAARHGGAAGEELEADDDLPAEDADAEPLSLVAAARLAVAAAKPRPRIKGAKPISVRSRARLPPNVQRAIMAEQTAARAARERFEEAEREEREEMRRLHREKRGEKKGKRGPSGTAEKKAGEEKRATSSSPSPSPAPSTAPSTPPPQSTAAAAAVETGDSDAAALLAQAQAQASGLGSKAWEDGELMKALQSVSLLDRRADEYRERLRVLKEQIHHHAALADALVAAPPTPPASLPPASAAPVPVATKQADAEVDAATGHKWVAVADRQRALAGAGAKAGAGQA